jgi:hypothetical protein
MKRRIFNQVRTDLLEKEMSHYLANGEFEKYEAIKSLSASISAPVNLQSVVTEAISRRKVYFGEETDTSNLTYLLEDNNA